MSRKKIVVGNWKMNPGSFKLAEKLFKIVVSGKKSNKIEVVACPPSVYFTRLYKISKKVALGAQNIHFETRGAYTGEVSSEMVYDAGGRYVILGHSERRALGETDEMVNKKIKSALYGGLTPIICVGERVRDHSHGYFDVIKNQIQKCFTGISKDSVSKIIITYEPVWAIGKGAIREATPEEFREVAVFIRKVLSDMWKGANIQKVRILYGGSVNPKNSQGFIREGEADGFLVGRDSLDAKKFLEIIKTCEA